MEIHYFIPRMTGRLGETVPADRPSIIHSRKWSRVSTEVDSTARNRTDPSLETEDFLSVDRRDDRVVKTSRSIAGARGGEYRKKKTFPRPIGESSVYTTHIVSKLRSFNCPLHWRTPVVMREMNRFDITGDLIVVLAPCAEPTTENQMLLSIVLDHEGGSIRARNI